MVSTIQSQLLTAVAGGILGVLFNFIFRDLLWSRIEEMRRVQRTYHEIEADLMEFSYILAGASVSIEEDEPSQEVPMLGSAGEVLNLQQQEILDYRSILRRHAASPDLELQPETVHNMAYIEGILSNIEENGWPDDEEDEQELIEILSEKCAVLITQVADDSNKHIGSYSLFV